MKLILRSAVLAPLLTVLTLSVGAAWAQKAAQTPTEFFMSYRAAFAKAKKIEEVLPYMAKSHRAEVEATPAAERPKMFELVKMMNDLHDVKVTKETKDGNKYILEATALDSDNANSTGKITIIMEDGGWKVENESWMTKS